MLRQLPEIAPCLDLLEDVIRLRLIRIQRLRIDLAVISRKRRLNQNVPHQRLFGNAVLIRMLLVVALEVALADRNLRCHLRRIHHRV